MSSGIPSCLVSAIATRYVGGNDQELDVEKDKELVGDAVELDSLFVSLWVRHWAVERAV